MDKTGIIIQARLGSKRLPQKMILPFFESMGILECLVGRLINSVLQPIVVATTENVEDDAIESLAKRHKIDCFRGDEHNVLSRFIKCAEKYSFNKIIRICADNPFLDIPSLLDLISKMNSGNYDYVSFSLNNGVPVIQTHYGFWAEGVSLEALRVVARSTSEPLYTEHVTNFIYSNCNRNKFKIEWIEIPSFVESSNIRLTVDTQQDFVIAQQIYKAYMQFEERSLSTLIAYIISSHSYLSAMQEQISLNQK